MAASTREEIIKMCRCVREGGREGGSALGDCITSRPGIQSLIPRSHREGGLGMRPVLMVPYPGHVAGYEPNGLCSKYKVCVLM